MNLRARRSGDQSPLAHLNALVHDYSAILLLLLPLFVWFATMAGVQWVGSPKMLGARIDTVTIHQRHGDSVSVAEAARLRDTLSLINRKLDVIVILTCTKLTTDQKRLVQQVFTCLP